MKVIRVTMPNGDKYDVEATVVAANRADHYVSDRGLAEWTNEYNFTYNDTPELIDWAKNNMNWEDVEDYATLAKEAAPVDFQDGWVNGDMEIVNK